MYGTHVLPLQQPAGHELALHVHCPRTHTWVESQAAHALPPVPHAPGDWPASSSQVPLVPPLQHPFGQVVALQDAAASWETCASDTLPSWDTPESCGLLPSPLPVPASSLVAASPAGSAGMSNKAPHPESATVKPASTMERGVLRMSPARPGRRPRA